MERLLPCQRGGVVARDRGQGVATGEAHEGQGMLVEPGRPQTLSLRGEVVEILDREGQRRFKVAVESGTILDLALAQLPDVHLGDHVLIGVSLRVERLEPDLETN